MSIMAKYIRIFLPDPQDEDVAKRNRAVADIQSWIEGLASPTEVIGVASSLSEAIAGGLLAEWIVSAVEKAIGDQSEAFVRDGQDLQIKVCAMVAALAFVRAKPVAANGWEAADALAAALWSALSFQIPVAEEAIELLRQELLEASRRRVAEVSFAARVRAEVPEVGLLTIPEADVAGSKANQAYKKATAPVIKVLRENAELDREELEFLWWVLSDWSDELDLSLAEFQGAARAVVAGIGGAMKLRKLPANGHRNVVMRSIDLGGDKLLGEVIVEIGAHGARLVGSFVPCGLLKSVMVFPLLSALAGSAEAIPGAEVRRSARDWGARALLEAGILRINASRGASK